MSVVKVNVKWGKQKFENVELDLSAPVELFKAQLFAMTNVPVERQKIMGVKGGSMKDDADLSALGIKAGQNLMLMGSAEAVPEAPKEATVFAEDMPAVDVAAMQTTNPGGLTNLGNTCYLNSTLQCMKAIPELSQSLAQYAVGQPGDTDPFVPSMRSLVGQLEKSNGAKEISPVGFVTMFRKVFPQFAETTEQGHFMQQDAEECWSAIVTQLSLKLQLAADGSSPTNLPSGQVPPVLPRMETLRRNLGDMLFGIEVESTTKCLDCEGEPPEVKRESIRTIGCNISDKTAHLYTALEVNLDEVIEKNSPTLGVEARYSKKSKLARLPPCLAVQFVRFAFRKDTNKRAKILRTVSFPPVLDIRNLCTPKLQAAINAHCTILERERDEASGVAPVKPLVEAPATAGGSAAAGSSSAEPMDVSDAAPAQTAEEMAAAAADAAGAECNDNRTGRYELFAIVTHQGRTAEGGHYVAWVKQSAKKWLVFDDETVAEIDAERIKDLHGGGDWHMAYMCLYRKMDTLTLDELDPTKAKDKLELKEIETKGFSMEGASKKSAN